MISCLWLNSSSILAVGTIESQGAQREGQTVAFLLVTLCPGLVGGPGKCPGSWGGMLLCLAELTGQPGQTYPGPGLKRGAGSLTPEAEPAP